MKNILLTLTLLFPCLVTAQNGRQHQIDSLRGVISQTDGEDRIKAYLQLSSHYYPLVKNDSIMKEFLALSAEIDAEAARQKRYDYQGMLQVNILGAYNNRGEHKEVIRHAPEYLDFLAEHEIWNYYYQICQTLCRSCWRSGDVKAALSEAKKMFEHAKSRQNNEGIAMALIAMGDVYGTQYMLDRQVECMQRSIELLRETRSFFHIRINACFTMCRALLDLNRVEEAQRYADEMENLILEYETIAKTPVLNARWNLWSIRVAVCTASGRYDEAEAWCRKLDSVNADITNRITVHLARAQILLSRRQYQKALESAGKASETYRKQVTFAGGYFMQNVRKVQIESLIKLGRAEDAYVLFKEDIAARDSISNVEVSARLDEIRTVYEVDKLEYQNEIITIEKERHRSNFLFALAGCILLLITLGIWIFYSRQIVLRNRELVRKNQQWANQQALEIVGKDKDMEIEKNMPADEDYEIVEQAHRILLDGLFKEYELVLDTLAVKMGIHSKTLSQVINSVTG
ncbi:MAG: hypothetical protein LBN27_10200, partial [Prevotellaceae bacterium]|nr:hypothetical protein [Prevotellaceae bacterium]